MASTHQLQDGRKIKIPDIGEAFINQAQIGAGIESIFIPTKDGLREIQIQDYIPGGYKNTVIKNSQLEKAIEVLKSQGINVNSLPSYNMGNISSASKTTPSLRGPDSNYPTRDIVKINPEQLKNLTAERISQNTLAE